MRSLTLPYADLAKMHAALRAAGTEQQLWLARSEGLADGEWVLAVFEVGTGRRATAAAARVMRRPVGVALRFEARDFERLIDFSDPAKQPRLVLAAEQDPETPRPVARAEPSPPPPPPEPPAAPDDTLVSARERDRSGPPAATPAPARVLLVDDDPQTRELVSVMLESVGLAVETAESAEAAVQRLGAGPVDLLVLDWRLPGMSGLDLCKSLRARPALAALPILFLTGNTSSADMVEALASGADDYVVKPFRAAELGARIFALLRRARLGVAAPA